MVTKRGFTLIELLIALAILASLLTYVGVRVANKVDTAKEQALRHNLESLRDSIDQFHADQGRFPRELSELVDKGYLRKLPVDPFTERADSWVLITTTEGSQLGVSDVHSGSAARSSGGSEVAAW